MNPHLGYVHHWVNNMIHFGIHNTIFCRKLLVVNFRCGKSTSFPVGSCIETEPRVNDADQKW